MTVSTKLMTADELLMLPENGKRYELVEGILNERALAGAVHGLTAMEAGVLLYQFVYPRGLGAVFAPGTGFVLSTDPDTVRAPDVAFVAAGCRLVWVVYPGTRSVTVHRSREDVRVLGEADVLDGSPVFDGFSAEVRDLFR